MTWPEQFTRQAIQDVEQAVDWLAENGSPAVARRMVAAVLRGARRVARFPLIGKSRPDLLSEPYRIWMVPGTSYLLVYNSGRQPPPIIRVLHSARDLSPILKDVRDASDA